VQQGANIASYVQGLRRTSPASGDQNLARKKSQKKKTEKKKQKKANK